MRLLAIAGALGLAVLATGETTAPADAGPLGPRYCAQYRGGGENCGFYTFNQCLSAISGAGGICIVAPMQTEVVDIYTRRGSYRILRDAID